MPKKASLYFLLILSPLNYNFLSLSLLMLANLLSGVSKTKKLIPKFTEFYSIVLVTNSILEINNWLTTYNIKILFTDYIDFSNITW